MHSPGFVDVVGAVEPSALAGVIATYAHRRVGEILIYATDTLEDEGNRLNQLQRMELASAASICMDGFERSVLDEILEHIEKIRLNTEGDDDAR